jgi:hypothetical protein
LHHDHQRRRDDADRVSAVVSALSDDDLHEHDECCRHDPDDMSMTDTAGDAGTSGFKVYGLFFSMMRSR